MSDSAERFLSRDARAPRPATARVLLLASLVTFGVVVGFAPVLGYLGIPQVLLPLGVVTWLAAGLLIGRRREALGPQAPDVREVAAATVGTLFMPAGTSYALLILHMIVWGVWYVVRWLLVVQFGVDEVVQPTTIAWYATVAFGVILYVGSGVELCQELPGDLYPNVVGMRSFFYDRVARGGWAWLRLRALAGVPVVAVCLLVRDYPAVWSFVLSVYLFAISAGLTRQPRAKADQDARAKTVDAVARLLGSAGYETVPRPRLVESEIDPLLARVDLLARKGEESLVAAVLTEAPDDYWDICDAAQRVRVAAFALNRIEPTPAGQVYQPVVYYLGSPRAVLDEVGRAFPPVAVVPVDPGVVAKAGETSEAAGLQEIARPLHEFPRPRPSARGSGSVPA